MTLTPEEKRERERAYFRAYYQKNGKTPEAKEQHRLASQRYRARKPYAYRNYKLRLLEAEAGRPRPDHCEICGATDQAIMFDHCHQRGVFRGWICNNCNHALGCVNDDPSRLRKLIAYLERTKDIISPQLTLPV